jgi:hypothetical protein
VFFRTQIKKPTVTTNNGERFKNFFTYHHHKLIGKQSDLAKEEMHLQALKWHNKLSNIFRQHLELKFDVLRNTVDFQA